MDAQTLTVPLWGALVAGGGILVSVVGVVIWVFATFSTKQEVNHEAILVHNKIAAAMKAAEDAKREAGHGIKDVAEAMTRELKYFRGKIEDVDKVLLNMTADVSYIRGRLDPTNGKSGRSNG